MVKKSKRRKVQRVDPNELVNDVEVGWLWELDRDTVELIWAFIGHVPVCSARGASLLFAVIPGNARMEWVDSSYFQTPESLNYFHAFVAKACCHMGALTELQTTIPFGVKGARLLVHLGTISSLKKLTVQNGEGGRVLFSTLRSLLQCPESNLQALSIFNDVVTAGGIIDLALGISDNDRLLSLELVNLGLCDRFISLFVEYVEKSPKTRLQSLRIAREDRFGAKSFQYCLKLPTVRLLSLEFCNLRSLGGFHIPLTMESIFLEELNMSNSEIDPRVLEDASSKFKGMKVLILSHIVFPDEDLLRRLDLTKLPSGLALLDLTKVPFLKEELHSLKQSRFLGTEIVM